MARFTYPDMCFAEKEGSIRCSLMKRYYFDFPKEELRQLGEMSVAQEYLDFPAASEKKVQNKVGRVIEQGIAERLTHALYQKPTFYIRQSSGIPLIGSNEFGIVDRGSNIIEVKPLTGCNFTCTYCSVAEGKNKKSYDYLVECDYLIEVAAAVAAEKEHPVEFNIGPQGEPLLYPKLVELVRGLKSIKNCAVVSMNTNGSLLSEELIDALAAAGLTRINLSIPALDRELAAELAGVRQFPMDHLLKMLEYGKQKLNILLAPVLIPGKNEGEMIKLVELSKSIESKYPTIGIQNYLEYKGGRKVAKPLSWEKFFAFVQDLEKESGKSLKMSEEDFSIVEEQELPKPFRKKQVIRATLAMPGRYPREMVAVAENRSISVRMENTPSYVGKEVRVQLLRDKHNIYKGLLVR